MKQDVDSVIKFQERTMENKDIYYMNQCLTLAKKAYKKGEVPVGCIIVYDDVIIAKSYNQREKKNSCLAHAELLAIKQANKALKSWILENCTMYVTLEPCPMCAGAILQSRIKKVVYAAKEPKFGSMGSIIDLSSSEYKFNHKVEVVGGVLEEESSKLLKDFFKDLRNKKNN